MIYNYSLEIGAIFFMVIILIHFWVSRQFPVLQTKLFLLFLIFSILECTVDVFSCMVIGNTVDVPLWLNELLVFFYFIIQAVTYYLFYLYTVSVCGFSGKEGKRYYALGLISVMAELLIVFSAPFTNFLYYYDDKKRYFNGVGRMYLYICILITITLGALIAYKSRKRLRRKYKVIISTYFLISCFTLVVQFYYPNLIIAGMGRVCIILLMYLSMQNMGEYRDNIADTYNESAFFVIFREFQRKNDSFSIITMEVEKYYKLALDVGKQNAYNLLQQVVAELSFLGENHYIFHMGYGAFSVFTEGGEAEAKRIAASMRELLQRKWIVDERTIYLNGNVVIQNYPAQCSNAIESVSLTNYLLEKAAALGNNIELCADTELVNEFKRNEEVEKALDYAIKQRLFEVYYQPIYSLHEKKVISAEALVRLFDRNLGFIPPSEFIPIAEKNGRIIPLGTMVLEKTCCFIRDKLLTNPDNPIKEIHINISAIQCMQADMADQIIEIIDKYKVPPEMIYLEVTEQTTMSATYLMREHMKKLGEIGIRFALDDYGTGNSNCSYLIDFSFQKVKFDRFMMQAYFKKEEAKVILQNEIKTLRKLGISVVVEGIETREQVEEMQEQRVDYIQGYYYAKPMPGAEFLEYLTKWDGKYMKEKRIPSEVLTLC